MEYDLIVTIIIATAVNLYWMTHCANWTVRHVLRFAGPINETRDQLDRIEEHLGTEYAIKNHPDYMEDYR